MASDQVCLNCSKANTEDSPRLHVSSPGRKLETTQIVIGHKNNTVAEADFLDCSPSDKIQKHTEVIMKPLNVSNYYSELCSCGEIKIHCRCSHGQFSIWERVLPRNAHYWPKLKLSILICLGSVPLIFMLIYIIFYIL